MPVVLDLSSLWAGPLCGQLLGLRGARVIKVESIGRPDGARLGTSRFFDLLHGNDQESVALDFSNSSDLDFLRRLVRWSDVIIEASRPRALRHLGINAQEEVARGAIWLSISAYGREREDRVGFGDDVAAAGGLIVMDESPIPVADAIADPLSGLTAAAAVKCALESTHGWLLDVSMHAVSAHAAGLPRCDGVGEVFDEEASPEQRRGCSTRVLPPRHRAITTQACEIGKHTRALREELSRAPIQANGICS
jgi:crotonobetainyl-CoA:carnitine CoA-transferase CaiB-like acyl-CoA transferase